MKNLQHEWSKNDLVIAYYMTNWDLNGLGITKEDIVDSVIPETTVNSLNMQMANFRFLLNLDGYKLSDSSNMMKEIVDEYSDKNMNQIKDVVKSIIEKCDIKVGRNSRHNQKVNDRKTELNRISQLKYEKQLKDLGKFRRLVRV